MDAAATTDHIKLKQMFHNSSERRKTLICSLVSVAIIVLVGGAIFLCILWKQSTVNEKQEYGFICDTVDESHINHETDYCQHLGSVNCNITLLESIPQNLRYHHGAPRHKSTFHGWLKLLDSAKSSVYIASSYWTLRPDDLPVRNPSSWQGEYIFSKLIEVAKRGVDVKIVHEVDSKNLPNRDPKILQDMGLAEVRVLDMTRLIGAGIIHTKMWLVDNKHFYLGSANMDWRSLTQIKELGLLTTNCRCLANDMSKIFDIYWIMATPYSSIPKYWPSFLDTMYNKEYPLDLSINGDKGTAYLSSSPPQLCTSGRTTDIDSILDVIYKAKKFIHISVMDYSPTFLYIAQKRYWSIIDDALRSAAYDRGVQVHLMASDWEHTIPTMIPFLKSLAVVGTIESVDLEVRLFKVPASRRQARIPYSRVQHTKYMVTENVAYVGTSNWSADYFVNTAGIGLIINQTLPEFKTRLLYTETIHRQVQDVFDRDWNSPYTKSIWSY